MKHYQTRAVEYLSASAREKEKTDREQAAAEAAKKKAEAAAAPKGNRRQRRAQARYNTLLNRGLNKKLNQANSLGQGVSVSIGKDGGVHVKVSKSKAEKPDDTKEEVAARQDLVDTLPELPTEPE